MNVPSREHRAEISELDAACTRFARRVSARLNESTAELPPHVGERLRLARTQALHRAGLARQRAPARVRWLVARPAGDAARGQPSSRWWSVFSTVPLLVLLLGLMMIAHYHERARIDAAAQVDAALLSDSLPPAAYRDPGFIEFLKRSDP